MDNSYIPFSIHTRSSPRPGCAKTTLRGRGLEQLFDKEGGKGIINKPERSLKPNSPIRSLLFASRLLLK